MSKKSCARVCSLCGSVGSMKGFVVTLGIIFVILGLGGVLHPNFEYHKREEFAKIGPVTATIDKPHRVTVPWLVARALLAAGAVLIVLGPKIKQ